MPFGDYFASESFAHSSPPWHATQYVCNSYYRGMPSELFLAWRSSAKNKSDASFLGWLPQSLYLSICMHSHSTAFSGIFHPHFAFEIPIIGI